jgi:hypothetical protein
MFYVAILTHGGQTQSPVDSRGHLVVTRPPTSYTKTHLDVAYWRAPPYTKEKNLHFGGANPRNGIDRNREGVN